MAWRGASIALLVAAAFALGWWLRGAAEPRASEPAPTPERPASAPQNDGRLQHPTLQGREPRPAPDRPTPAPQAGPVPASPDAPVAVDPHRLYDHFKEIDVRRLPLLGPQWPLDGEGTLRARSSDGRERLEAEYRNGQFDGAWKVWHADGRPAETGRYAKGNKAGTWRTYHPSGELATEATFGEQGQEGLARAWRTNGSLVEESTYEAGRLHGPYRAWHVDGRTLQVEGRYAEGVKDGRWTWYDARGRAGREEDWKAGNLEGLVRILDTLEGALPEAEALAKANVDGKYSNLLRRIAAPDDRENYEDFYDYGPYPATSYTGEAEIPAGHWVYVYPYWYVWAEARTTAR